MFLDLFERHQLHNTNGFQISPPDLEIWAQIRKFGARTLNNLLQAPQKTAKLRQNCCWPKETSKICFLLFIGGLGPQNYNKNTHFIGFWGANTKFVGFFVVSEILTFIFSSYFLYDFSVVFSLPSNGYLVQTGKDININISSLFQCGVFVLAKRPFFRRARL